MPTLLDDREPPPQSLESCMRFVAHCILCGAVCFLLLLAGVLAGVGMCQ
jgi:hypothetical protein